MSAQDFFELENKIIEYDFVIKEKNLMIWPLVRWTVLYYLSKKKQDIETPHARLNKFSFKNIKLIYYALKFAAHRINRNSDIIFYTSARGRLNNKNFNINTDYYSHLIPNSLVIDNSYQGKFYIPNNTENFLTAEFSILKSLIFHHIKKTFSKKQISSIERFIRFLKRNTDVTKGFAERIRKELYQYYHGYDYYSAYINKIFQKLQPKIIFVHSSTYGAYKAILIKIAKENDVKTGEFQHGIISRNHIPYSYGDEVFNNKRFQQYLPDYLLTFGNYWNQNVKIPSKKITIGNPHFYESLKKVEEIKEQKDSVLIISQGTITDKFVSIAKSLSEKYPSFHLFFKLHPGEVPFESRYEELSKYQNIQIIKTGDIYHYIARSEYIVACYSTAILETLGFNKKLFILDNEMSRREIPEGIGMRFKENEDLDLKSQLKEVSNPEQFFDPEWKKNYMNFLREEIGIK